MLAALREHSDEDCCQLTVEMLNRGVSPQSIWDALMVGAGELLMRQPGIVALHSVTSTNAMHFAYRTAASDETRRLLLLQNTAFLPLFRQAMTQRGKIGDDRADQLEPAEIDAKNPGTIEEIFAAVGSNNRDAARKVLGYLGRRRRPAAPDRCRPIANFHKRRQRPRLQIQCCGVRRLPPCVARVAESVFGHERVQPARVDQTRQ